MMSGGLRTTGYYLYASGVKNHSDEFFAVKIDEALKTVRDS